MQRLVQRVRKAIKMSVTVVCVPVESCTGQLRNRSLYSRRSFLGSDIVLLQTGISNDNLWVHKFQNRP